MPRRNIYYDKKSEYRQNYLPFDYFDFWITARENQNQRFKNKIRDYLHTPFDWDEDQEYLVIENDIVKEQQQLLNKTGVGQSTQTTSPINSEKVSERQVTQKTKDQKNLKNVSQNQPSSSSSQSSISSISQIDTLPSKTVSENKKNTKVKIVENQPKQNTFQNEDTYAVNNIQINDTSKHIKQRHSRSTSAKRRARKLRKEHQIKSEFQTNFLNNVINSKNVSNFDKSLSRSISSMSVQTPAAWNLRDYDKKPTQKQKIPSRPSSVNNYQIRKPPFANYGWANRTKDMSIKPTHNAIANKNLAELHHDQDAILELTLQKLKRDATAIANEYSLVESKVAERFLNGGRSDSRAWNSEYDDKYPDYSASVYNKDLYLTQNPNRLSKSSLVNDYPQLVRGPRSAKSRIYFQK